MFVGYNFNGIPVIDEMILNSYFDSPRIRILSVPRKNKEVKDIAWYQLYTNLKELKENFPIYLSDPPQLLFRSENFEYKELKIPSINESSFKIIKRSLVPKQLTPSQIMMNEHKFTVCKSDDYEEEISKIQVIL